MRNLLHKALAVSICTIVLFPLLMSFNLVQIFAGYITAINMPSNYVDMGIPIDVLALPDGGYWYTDTQNARIIRVNAQGVITRTVGGLGNNEGDFQSAPVSITRDNDGLLYVLESESCRVDILDFNGGLLGTWGSCGDVSEDGKMSAPLAITYDAFSDSIYISDSAHNQIQKFSKDGTFISRFGTTGSGNGNFQEPVGLMTDSNGKIYVVDTNNHRVQVFNSNGSFSFKFGSVNPGDDQFIFPKDVEILSNGDIVVSSQNDYKLRKFDSTGNFIMTWGMQGSADNQFNAPHRLSHDAADNIYVTDFDQKSIQKYTKNGAFISSFRNSGKLDGRFAFPSSAAYDSAGNMYVVDDGAYQGRVQKFTNSGIYTTTIIQPGNLDFASYHIAINAQDKIFVTGHNSVRVFDLSGNPLFSFGTGGTDNGEISDARGIDFDSQGNIYITDLYNHRVQKFDSNGVYISQWGGAGMQDGKFQFPEALYIDSNDHIFVGENPDPALSLPPNTRVQEFDVNGNFIRTIGSVGAGNGQFDLIQGITKDSTGKMYVSDPAHNRIVLFDTNYQFISFLGTSGSGDNQFTGQSDITINPVTDTLTVSDTSNHRMQLFDVGVQIKKQTYSIDVVRSADSFSLIKNYLSPNDPSITNINSNMFFGDYIVSSFSVNLSTDRNWDPVYAQVLPDSSKALVGNLNPTDAPGVSNTHSLYVVKQPDQTAVFVCPNAMQLDDLNVNCPGGYIRRQGDSGLHIVHVNGVDYWQIDNLTGTGALGLNTQGLGMNLSTTNVNINQPMSITLKALDIDANQDPTYHGTVHFTSTSPTAILPADFTFTAPDNGIYTFTNQVTFTEAGDYTITATDIADPDLRITSDTIHVTALAPTNTPVPTNTTVPTSITNTTIPTSNATAVPTLTATPAVSGSCTDNPIQAACQVDVTINNVVVTQKGDTSMQICWDTNIETKGSVRYGLATDGVYSNATLLEETYTANGHCVILDNLTNNTKYIYRIVAGSAAAKTANYDAEFTVGGLATLPVTGSDAVECITTDQAAFNSLNQVRIDYRTSVYGICSVDYGNNDNRAKNQATGNVGVIHSSVLDLLKVDGKSDIYYQINCTIKDTNANDKMCKYNGIITTANYVPYVKNSDSGSLLGLINNIFSTPTKSSQTLATTAVAGTATTAVIATVAYPQWLSYGLLWFQGKKKSKPWGVVYEAASFIPIPFAVIRVLDSTGKQIRQSISDAKGRFGFVLDFGQYTLNVSKPGYSSFEKTITINQEMQNVTMDIALIGDTKPNKFLVLQRKFKENLSLISLILTVVGFIVTLISVIIAATTLNLLVLLVYIIQGWILALSLPAKSWGAIHDSITKGAIKGAFVRLFDPAEGRQVDVQIVDAKGRYGFIADKKDYLLKVDAEGYKFPGSKNNLEVVQTKAGENFVKIDAKSDLNYDFELDPE